MMDNQKDRSNLLLNLSILIISQPNFHKSLLIIQNLQGKNHKNIYNDIGESQGFPDVFLDPENRKENLLEIKTFHKIN